MALPSLFGSRNFHDYALLARIGLVLDDLRGKGLNRLPPETELCRRLDVNRTELHRILQTLSREGVLHQIRNKGWFFPPAKLDIPVSKHNSYTSNMRKQQRVPRSEVLCIDQTTESEGGDTFLSPEVGRLWVLDFRRFNGDLAFSLARVRIPVEMTPNLNSHLGPNVSLYQTLEREYGIRPERLHTWCEAVAADPIVAEALAIPVGAPLLKATHHAIWNKRPFEITVNYLRADSCRVRVDLASVEEETS